MIRYNGYQIWFNPLQGWMIQAGVEVVKVAATLAAAKAWTTKYGTE